MKKNAVLVLFFLVLLGCKVSMDDCYRAIYDYVGPKGAESFVMEVTQKGVIQDIIFDEDRPLAWIKTEPDMWVDVELPPESRFEIGDRVSVVFLVKFRKGGRLLIEKKWIQ